MNKGLLNIIIACFLLAFSNVYGQHLHFTNFNKASLLGKDELNAMVQNDDLTVYIATNEGIITYNTIEFTSLDLGEKLNNADIKDLGLLGQKLYFIASEGFYSVDLNSDSVQQITSKNLLGLEIHQSSLFAWNSNAIYQVNEKALNEVYEAQSPIQNILFTPQHIYIGTKKGLEILDNSFELQDRTASYLDIQDLAISPDSTVAILSKNALFDYNTEGAISRLTNWDTFYANALIVEEDGTYWIGTNNGLIKYNGIIKDTIQSANGLDIQQSNALFKDKENNLWVLGNGKLSFLSFDTPFQYYEDVSIKHLASNGNEVLVGLSSNENYLVNQDSIIVPNQFLKFGSLNHVKFANKSWHLFTGSNRWIKLSAQGKVIRSKSLPKDWITHTILSNGNILVQANNGTLVIKDETLNSIEEIPLDDNSQIITSKYNNYIISSSGKVSVLDSLGNYVSGAFSIPNFNKSLRLYAGKNGLFSVDESQNVYYASNTFKTLLWSPEKSNTIIFNIYEDNQSNIWVSTNKNLNKLTIRNNDYNDVSDIEIYSEADNINSTIFNTVAETSDKKIWFGGNDGLLLYNPLVENPNVYPPSIIIKNAFAYNEDFYGSVQDTTNLLQSGAKVLANHTIVIQPWAVSYNKQSKLTYKYRILSQNQNWIPLQQNNPILISDLPDGNATIEIKAVSAEGIESVETANIIFTVSPPLWKKKWFYITSVASLILIGFIGYKTVTAVRDNRAKELRVKLDKELEELERRSHLQVLKAERLKQLNELISAQKSELESKNKQIESQKYELSLTNGQIKKQKDLLEETGNKLKASINYAQRIQNALMSTEVELKTALDESFVFFQPRDLVSGDFFWFKEVKNEQGQPLLLISAVDCTGHGVPGAIVSVVGMNLLNNIALQKKIHDPGEILAELNEDIIHNLRQDETQVNDGMDMSLVSLNLETKEIKFAGAKNPLYVIEDGELNRIRGSKHAIGGQQRSAERIYETHRIDCADGKERFFYLFSDGYQDQFGGEKGFKFLTSNFKDLLVKIHNTSVLDQKEALHEKLIEWKGEYPQTDDILVIGFKF